MSDCNKSSFNLLLKLQTSQQFSQFQTMVDFLTVQMLDIQRRIDDRLNQIFKFKKVGEWYRHGICPQCGKKECYTHAHTPRVVKCSRLNNCGYEEHVKDICEDLFKDWSKRVSKTETNPHAAADAYLRHACGFDLAPLKGLYTQDTFSNEHKYPGLYTSVPSASN